MAKAIDEVPDTHLGIVVVIPCHDEPYILRTLHALAQCQPPHCWVEVIVVINASTQHHRDIHRQNLISFNELENWLKVQTNLPFKLFPLHFPDLPVKHAGVGLARRIGMDLAAKRLFEVGKPKGVIVNLDADCTVAQNYFQALEAHFQKHPETPGCSIWFEHPLEGKMDSEIYTGIAHYELFLRYYINGLRYAGLPCAFQTIGSAMAVRANIYRQQGGMNRRKAGEDFYFLHKIIELGHFTELNQSCVYPSPRVSDRVPFGTGKAVKDWLKNREKKYPTYTLQTYIDLKKMVDNLDSIFPLTAQSLTNYLQRLGQPLQNYLHSCNFENHIQEIFANSANYQNFQKRFFRWFNGFRAMKSAHFLRDEYYGEQDLIGESYQLLGLWGEGIDSIDGLNAWELLQRYRQCDRLWA